MNTNTVPAEEVEDLIPSRPMLADQVFEAVLSLLLDDKIPTGAPLSIDGLAKRFKVSSTPVREALARLEATGMIKREALRGYRVAPEPTAKDAVALLTTRQVLEPACARLACENSASTLVAELERVHRILDQSRHGGSTFAGYRAYWRADEEFHRLIVEATDNEFLIRAYGSVEGHIQRFRLMVQNDLSGDDTQLEHEAIIEAFRANDTALAETAMAAHISGIGCRLRGLPRFNPDLDAD
ncbi:GntR family transcriptional regulator [Paenarthrobacter nicotinovorans]|uniref:GntR family transcriptional regulator n=1 Tax=Paenarthrobacter nicotinovorans TaxID=29320 RepID=UPI00380CD117